MKRTHRLEFTMSDEEYALLQRALDIEHMLQARGWVRNVVLRRAEEVVRAQQERAKPCD